MSSTTSYRLSGIALILGSVLSIIYYVSEVFINGLFPEALAGPVAVIGSLIGFIGSVLVLLGLPGMYARQAKSAGILGLLGFLFVWYVILFQGILITFTSVTIVPMLVTDPATRHILAAGRTFRPASCRRRSAMNLAQRKKAPKDTIPATNLHFDTRLHGRWLLAARVIWIALALAIVVLNALALPGVPAALNPPEVLRELHRLNLSPAPGVALFMGTNGMCTLLYLTISALLFWRRSDDRMAFFCSLMLLTFGGAVFGFLEYAPPTSLVWNLAFYSLFFLGQVSFLTFFYLFPSGRFVPRWTRWCALLYAIYWVAWLSFLGGLASGQPGGLFLLFLLTAVIAQVYRYRSVSTRAERQQTKWVVFAAIIVVGAVSVANLVLNVLPSSFPALGVSTQLHQLISALAIYLLGVLIPLSIGIALLRYRLWDIDIIINRSLVYGSLTILLALIYFGLVIGLGSLVRLFTGQVSQSPIVIVASTVAIYALFQPLRHRIQRIIDRRFYRSKCVRSFAALRMTRER